MGLTVTQVSSANTQAGKVGIFDCTFDSSYASGGEVLDLSSANTTTFTGSTANDYFRTVASVEVLEGPYDSSYASIAETLAATVKYLPATARAVATGKLFVLKEDGTSGVTAETSGDASTVIVRIRVTGT